MSYQPDEQTAADLAIARRLAELGIPVFIAHPDPANKTGFVPPAGWQDIVPDPAVVDQWQPGLALCAVMGHGLDVIDIDPRNGGELAPMRERYLVPDSYGVATTPSGGLHSFIRSLGVAKATGLFPGIDVQAGAPDGSGRSFVFLAPTVRVSKETGEPVPYRWVQPLNLDEWMREGGQDATGTNLVAYIIGQRQASSVGRLGGPDWWQEFMLSNAPQSTLAADRAIEEKLREVSGHTDGAGENFRTVLMRAAMTLGGYVGGGYLDEEDARARLEAACSFVFGNANEDDWRWIDQGIQDGKLRPFYTFNPADSFGAIDEYDEDAEAWTFYNAVGGDLFEPLGGSDQELAECVLQRIQPGMRFALDAGTWLVRGQELWVERAEGAGSAVSALGRVMPLGDPNLPSKKADYTPENWQAVRRLRFLNSGTASSIERKMRTVVQITGHRGGVELAALDSDPHVLWAGGVPWDLRSSVEIPTPARWVSPDAPHMHSAWVAPDPTVPTPRWDAFVAAVWPEPSVRGWALRVLSIGLTGYPDAALPILYGRERSGKTSLVEMLATVLGTYGRPANAKLLGAGDSGHDVIVYELKGARLAYIDEGPRKGFDATERLKQLTGGGKLTGRGMRANPIAFSPTHTLVMTTNNEPQLTDPALRARARLIPCNADEKVVRPLRRALLDEADLRAEAPGILAAMMREAGAWLLDRDSASIDAAPASVRGLAAEIAEGQDPVRDWVFNCTVPADPGTPGRQLYGQFAEWHQSKALYRRAAVPSETAFGRTLTDMGYVGRKLNGLSYRPLSVLGGPSYPVPTPSPAAYMGGRVEGPSKEGFSHLPSHPENPRSEPVFSSLEREIDSLYVYKEEKEEKSSSKGGNHAETQIYGEKPSLPLNPPLAPTLTCEDMKERASDTSLPAPSTLSPAPAKAVVGGLTREAAEVARRASEGQLTKAQVRAQLKEESRQDAIYEASGEHIGLPAVVDRAGNVLSISWEQAGSILEACLSRAGGALTVDVETSGYPVGHVHHKLRSVQLGDEGAAVVLDPDVHADVIRSYLEAATTLHAHSASADIVPIAHHGLADADAMWAKMIDTVIPAKLADPASTGSDPGLKKLSEAVLGPESTAPAADEGRERVFKAGKWLTKGKSDTPPERLGWAQIDTGCESMLRYAASDVLDTAMLARRLPPVAPAVLGRERIAEEMTARIASRGLKINESRVRELTEHHTSAQAHAAARITAFGIENPGSTKQVAEKLLSMGAQLPVSEKGNPSVAEHVLAILKDAEGDCAVLATALLDYRHSSTALGLFLEPYRLICELGDGRARPTIYTLGTDTGRMSSVRPNFQQLPRSGGVRSVVVADEGMCFISADFSGVELRGAAALSQDPQMMHAIREEDAGRFDGFHWQVARQAFGPEATKEHRYIAKRGCFGTFYGGGAAGLAKQVGVPESEMRIIIDSLKAVAPTFFVWADQMRSAVRQGRTQFPTYSGRIIHMPLATPHKGPAYAIQGTCRELLVDGLIRFRETQWGNATILPVHDEIIAMVPIEDAVPATEALVECMRSQLYGVEIVADPGKREEWGSTYWRDST